MRSATTTIKRCSWVRVDDPLMLQYHDREWGVPVHDDRRHFEFLVLEGAQAGLSWTIVLKKREGYRRAFQGFDPEKVARFSVRRIEKLVLNTEIIATARKSKPAAPKAAPFSKSRKSSEASTPIAGASLADAQRSTDGRSCDRFLQLRPHPTRSARTLRVAD